MRICLASLLLVLCTSFLTGCQPPNNNIQAIEGPTMGTTYHIKWVAPEKSLSVQQVQTQVDQVLVQVNKEMSTYDPESELSRFNKLAVNQSMAISDGTATVIAEAIRLGDLTGGVLDVTVGPLVNLWGFGPQARPEKIPSQESIDRTKARTGLQFLNLSDHQLTKTHEALYVDLSTIAKGFGVDRVAELLASMGIENYLVEVGGEMRLAGNKPDGAEWRVAVEKPVSTQRAVGQIISVGDNAVATSGDYRNYYEQDGIRYSHLIDPVSGYPIQHNLVSVTVIHPSCMTADGLATAINVMGVERGKAFALENNLAVMLVSREKEGFVIYKTPDFEPYLR